MGWFMSHKHFVADLSRVTDLLKYPELRFLDRYAVIVPACLGVGVFLLGALLEHFAPGLHTTGWQMLVWGFTSYILKLMSFIGVIWDLKPVPLAVREGGGKRL
jgi:hypothetical protein